MASIKVKFRTSSVSGKSGSLTYQVIHKQRVRYISARVHIDESEWDNRNNKIIVGPASDPYRAGYLSSAAKTLREGADRLKAVILHLENLGADYTVDDIVAAFNTPSIISGVISFTRRLIDDMMHIGKKSTVRRLDVSLNSLLRYTEGCEVAWQDLTPTFMLGYEGYMMERGLCRNSTSFYMRNLRSIVNRASEMGYVIPNNPFKYVYVGIDKTVKRGVPLAMMCKIRDLNLSGHPALDFTRNIFMFSFYTRGMSFVDMAFLKKSDLDNGVITYSRRKTRQQLQVRMEPEIREVMERLGKSKSSYLLPIITDDSCDPVTQYEEMYFRVNRNIQKVGRMLSLSVRLTLYVARHSWASIAHANHVSLGTISRAMGHDSETTTLIYLKSLDTSSVDKANSDIIRMMDAGRNKRARGGLNE